MGLTYFKRFRMEIDITDRLFTPPALPTAYEFVPWDPNLLDIHAETKYRSFRFEIDANVFPCLGERSGCQRLMTEISRRDGFSAGSTWLVVCPGEDGSLEYCATIQGLRDRSDLGAIQNIGVTSGHRGHGLGSNLVFRALEGFQRMGLQRAYLEVTAQNSGALRLYERLGFHTVKTVYKTAEVAYA